MLSGNVIPVRPDPHSGLAETLDAAIRAELAGQHVLLRCISSLDHPGLSKAELVDQIVRIGTDKYDRDREAVGRDYYARWAIDFFATEVEVDAGTAVFAEILRDFEEGALEGRGHSVRVDIVLVYRAACRMVEGVYDGQTESDAFCFSRSLEEARLSSCRPRGRLTHMNA